MQNYISLRH